MECRRSLVLALGLLSGVGCTHPFGHLRPNSQAKKSEDVTHKAATYVAFGDFRTSSGFDPAQTPAAQQRYREDARLAYLKALDVDPNCMPALVGLARLQVRCEDHAGAEQTYRKALNLEPRDAGLWHDLAVAQCRKRDFNAAVESLRAAVELSPGNRQYQTMLGYTLGRAGRMEESFTILAQAHGEARAHLDLARMFQHGKQPLMARRHLARALELDPQSPAGLRLQAELDGKPTQPEIRTVGHAEPATPRPGSTPAAPPAPAPRTTEVKKPAGKPIRMPPLPVIETYGR
jgi:tetratricopeptide (TPR) repeat protein